LDCSGAQIRLRWRADVNQPSMQSARPLLADGRPESTGFVVAGPPTTAGECDILLERVVLSHTSKLPNAVPNLHSAAADGVLNEATLMFADLEARAARNTFYFP
jgi:hypothetical protein